MLKVNEKNKKILIYIIAILLIPMIIPLITTIVEIFIALGRNLGTYLRNIVDGVCCIK